MEYVSKKNIDLTQLVKLYDSVGWSAYTKNPEDLETAIHNSLQVVVAVKKDEIVGLIRVVGDGITIIYIQDLLVKPKFQQKGIGTQLVKTVLKNYQEVRQKVLLTEESPITRGFYEDCGFTSCDHGEEVAFYREF